MSGFCMYLQFKIYFVKSSNRQIAKSSNRQIVQSPYRQIKKAPASAAGFFAAPSSYLLRNSDGLQPNCFLKAREK
jgi:hypothetical protein